MTGKRWPWMTRKPRSNTTSRVPRAPRASTMVRAIMKATRAPVVRKGKRVR